ncbi:hypothetical protein lbkm_1932 [Lachnospiraceae bacterium KM106-2]|nr:hypothetical protein lbkm_1932 [Lachnospiraceae bacterium KM106-2]
MVGYLKAYFPDLRIFEYQDYKAFYCGICLDIKEEYGELSRFFLNYDITFMAILLSSYEQESVQTGTHRCILNPIQKKKIHRSEYTKYFAAMNMIFAYHKLDDSKKDDHSKVSAALELLMKRKYKQVRLEYPRETAIFDTYMKKLNECEANQSNDYEYLGEIFGDALQQIIEPKVVVEKERPLVGKLFYYIGQWIYNIDALDDLEDDIKNDQFNPFRELYEKDQEHFLSIVEQYFNRLLFGMIATYDEMEIMAHPGIINNVICIALRRKTSDILTKYKKEKEAGTCKENN